MKKLNLLSAFVMCIALQSCSKRIDCEPGDLRLSLASFTSAERDTIILRRFAKNSNYTSLKDTLLVNEINSYVYGRDTVTISFVGGVQFRISSDYDFEIFVPATRKLTRVSLIVDKPSERVKHLLAFDTYSGPCYNPIISFYKDGQIFYGETLLVAK